jgi:GTP-binding protein
MLVHIIDLSAGDRESIMRDYALVDKELASYSADLAARPVIIAGSKIDLPEAAQAVAGIQEAFRDMGVDFIPISAATGDGVDALKYAIGDRLGEVASSET